MKGKRGRGNYGKTLVFGIFQQKGEAYTKIVPACSKATLRAIIRGRVDLEECDLLGRVARVRRIGLVDMRYQWHLQVAQGKDEFAKGTKLTSIALKDFWASLQSAWRNTTSCLEPRFNCI